MHVRDWGEGGEKASSVYVENSCYEIKNKLSQPTPRSRSRLRTGHRHTQKCKYTVQSLDETTYIFFAQSYIKE